MQRLTVYYRGLVRLLGNNRFIWVITALLVLQALWIALSGLYPMAFDEDFHLGIIRLYADNHFSPFLHGQPAGADAFGAVARDPSYLYHYIMSYPYRLIGVFTDSQSAQVLILRFMNIALFASSLPLYRRLLLKTGARQSLVHFGLLLFVLIPVVPLLAAQLNYDNLIMPLTALVLLLTLSFTRELRATKRFNVQTFAWLVVGCLLGSLVKYAFLPIVLAVALYIAIGLFRTYKSWRKMFVSIGFGYTLVDRRMRWLLLVLLIVSGGLFVQRYGVNVVRYHKPVVACDQVLTVQQCSAYGPWLRDYHYKQDQQTHPTHTSLTNFTGEWFYGMWLRSFFAVDGPTTHFQTRGPLPVPGITAIVGVVASAVVLGVAGKRVYRRYDKGVLWLFAATAGIYIATLFMDEYGAYMRTGQPVAINGRYLFPVLPLLLMLAALGWQEVLHGHAKLKAVLAGMVLVGLIWGGGSMTYSLRSNDAWYWHSGAVRGANHGVQAVLGPITPGYHTPTMFLSHKR